VVKQNSSEAKAVSQIEQLTRSKCASGSAGKLWCGTCHNPHGKAADRNREIRDICSSCHALLSKAAHSSVPNECVSCHMPRVPTEYAHVAVTDHRIVRRSPVSRQEVETGPKTLVVWMEPPAQVRRPDSANPRALAAKCEILLKQGNPREAVGPCRRAAELEPESADRAMALGTALAKSGDLVESERQLRRAIQIDPSLKHAYVELWTLYDSQRRAKDMDDTLQSYLNWNPRSVMFRVLKSAIEMESILADLPTVLLRP
jgi:tetratricopeptide (TPR) repeat protein